LKGTVKFWNQKKGYGFLIPSNGGPDVFCHANAIVGNRRELLKDEPVEYEAEATPKGIQATIVQRWEENNARQG